MATTKIMVIRHAEKPGTYNGQSYNGVDTGATTCAANGAPCLATIGWQRAGALITLFVPPWGPKRPMLAQPDSIYAADPSRNGGKIPSRRPHDTVLGVAAQLKMPINTKYKRGEYVKLAREALRQDGVVLICWRQEKFHRSGNASCPKPIPQPSSGCPPPGQPVPPAGVTILSGYSTVRPVSAKSPASPSLHRCCSQVIPPHQRHEQDRRIRAQPCLRRADLAGHTCRGPPARRYTGSAAHRPVH